MIDASEAGPKLAKLLENVEDGLYAVAIKMHHHAEDEGVVLAFRPSQGDFITWEWAAHGRPMLLHTGHYDMDYDEAMMDFEARGR